MDSAGPIRDLAPNPTDELWMRSAVAEEETIEEESEAFRFRQRRCRATSVAGGRVRGCVEAGAGA
ncbi:hypothetical protein DCC26_02835 [Auritidibacter sp. NML120779]|nr:hypothetical protein DCC26_02835 [Auritidibacter sp. NML120779]